MQNQEYESFYTLREGPQEKALPIVLIPKSRYAEWFQQQPDSLRSWFEASSFRAEIGRYCVLPGKEGGPKGFLAYIESEEDLWSYAALAQALPGGKLFRIENSLPKKAATHAALGWALAAYNFNRYRQEKDKQAHLIWPKEANRTQIINQIKATFLIRDLINTPANDMGPDELEFAAYELAKTYKAKMYSTVGKDLLKKNFPLIYAVGQASPREPRLIDIRYTGPGAENGPKITLIGKGVCFDTGGLDIKPSRGMRLMKKDMGGAAHVLGLGSLIMAEAMPVQLRILIPAVDNAISGIAMRPLDVVKSRKGLTVEIGNTDAEGRLVLADALTYAAEENPDIIIDFATLTGAARVALGAELPALFSNNDKIAETLLTAAKDEGDHMWRLPLFHSYSRLLKSKTADLSNMSEMPYGGAILAALFMEHFVSEGKPWVHLDLMGWNLEDKPGRPVGGEAMGVRAVMSFLRRWIVAKT